MRQLIPRDTMGPTPPRNPGGRPEVGPKIDVRLPLDTLRRLDDRAEAARKSRADTIRTLIGDGLEHPRTLAELAAERTLELVDQVVDGDRPHGVSVHSSGRTFWLSSCPDGWILAHSRNVNLIAAFQGAALLAFQRLPVREVTPHLDSDEPAFPALVAAGRAILDDIGAQERLLARNLNTMHWPPML
ncbi:hypothetical protein ACIPLC_27685 [Kitasatospora sp. NPDC086801]|uniref:hypothetical protein n=1 Tax=Kitasatospora sp. NPDC086801 TaxID=3364066 RepID=UPI00382AF255